MKVRDENVENENFGEGLKSENVKEERQKMKGVEKISEDEGLILVRQISLHKNLVLSKNEKAVSTFKDDIDGIETKKNKIGYKNKKIFPEEINVNNKGIEINKAYIKKNTKAINEDKQSYKAI